MNDQAPLLGRGLRTIAGGLDHPEGVCWSPDEQAVYAGGEAGQVYRFALEGHAVETVATVQPAAEQQYLLRHPPAAGVAATPFGIELP